ncbi:MAG: diadenylate cyclase [Deltaproteobacteria bacterium]|nr:diadenylate cyclase [Deltaproteobacteria bacterium]
MEAILEYMSRPFVGGTPWEVILQVLDILIVTYLVYRLLLIIRGTRSAALAISFLIIWVAYVSAPYLGLHTLHRLFETLFSELSMFVIFALIIFQDEIRRAMAQVGRFRKTTLVLEAQAIEEAVQAAGALARKRLGAIIVFEGKADLDEYITEGTIMDAALTRETLFATFIPSFENPIHDGAVIIRGLRIHKAGALLPLSTRSDLAKSLGTRHRAAIGITSHTDAVTIVVSEERGVISSCIDGNIVQDLDMANLRKLLLSRFRRARERGDGWGILDWWRRRRHQRITERKTVLLDPPPPDAADERTSKPSEPPVEKSAEGDGQEDEKKKGKDLGDSKAFAEFLGNKS